MQLTREHTRDRIIAIKRKYVFVVISINISIAPHQQRAFNMSLESHAPSVVNRQPFRRYLTNGTAYHGMPRVDMWQASYSNISAAERWIWPGEEGLPASRMMNDDYGK